MQEYEKSKEKLKKNNNLYQIYEEKMEISNNVRNVLLE